MLGLNQFSICKPYAQLEQTDSSGSFNSARFPCLLISSVMLVTSLRESRRSMVRIPEPQLDIFPTWQAKCSFREYKSETRGLKTLLNSNHSKSQFPSCHLFLLFILSDDLVPTAPIMQVLRITGRGFFLLSLLFQCPCWRHRSVAVCMSWNPKRWGHL